MEVFGKWNNLSKELLAEIPTLKPGQVVRFQMLNGAPNLHPDAAERAKQPTIYPKANINFRDRIFDKYKGTRGEMVDIGIWTSINEKDQPQFASFMPWAYGQHPYLGVFYLIGGRENDNEKFQYFWLCSDRKDNPNYKEGDEVLFEMVDYAKIDKSTIKKTNALRDALNAAGDMTLADKKDFAAAMGWGSEFANEDALDAKILTLAKDQPEAFMANYGDPELKKKAVLGYAAQHDVIKYDPATGKMSYSNSNVVFAKIDVPENKNWIDSLAEHVKTHRDGKKIFDNIKAQLKAPAAEQD